MAFTNTFTGKNTGVTIPGNEAGLRAQENMSNMILSAEKLKLETFQKNQAEFLKNANIDPVFVLSESAKETQARLLDNFNTKWGKTMQQSGGNLSLDNKLQMAKDKNIVLMEQQKMASEMEAAQTHNKMVMQNPNRWDAEEQTKRYNDYIATGTYNHTEPPIKPLSLTNAAMKLANKVATKEYIAEDETKTYSLNGVPYKKNITYSASRDDVAPYIKAAISDDPQYAAGAIKEWNELATPDKETYFKKNPANPIFEMAVDKHWKEWVKSEEKEVKNTSGTSRTTFDWNKSISSAHNKNADYPIQPQIKQTTAYGTFNLPDVMSLGVSSQTTEQQPIPEIIKNENGKEVIVPINDQARFNVISYSPSKDIIIVKILDDGETVEQDEVVALPAARYNDLLARKPFGIDRVSLIKKQLTQPAQPKKKAY
jgi:hypothetical protein